MRKRTEYNIYSFFKEYKINTDNNRFFKKSGVKRVDIKNKDQILCIVFFRKKNITYRI